MAHIKTQHKAFTIKRFMIHNIKQQSTARNGLFSSLNTNNNSRKGTFTKTGQRIESAHQKS